MHVMRRYFYGKFMCRLALQRQAVIEAHATKDEADIAGAMTKS
jgi:hypothetical protein